MLKSQEEHLLNQDTFKDFSSDCKGLYLHNPNISDIAVDTFSSLPNLDEIYIDDNKISILRSGVFRGTSSKLWKLGLSNDSISVLESGVFNGLKLSFLDLDHNPLTNVTSESFLGLSGSYYGDPFLDLSNTNLALTPGIFKHIGKLRALFVNHKSFHYTPHMWDGVDIGTLEMKYAGITELKREMFDGLEKSLYNVVLKGNNIQNIQAYSFQGLIKLAYIDLKDCNVHSIEALAFDGVPELFTVYLRGNPLINMDPNMFGSIFEDRPIWDITWLRFDRNTMECSPKICWLREKMLSGDLETDLDEDGTRCENSDTTVVKYLESSCI